MKNKFYIRHRTATLYLALYILAVVMLLIVGLIPLFKGDFYRIALIATSAFMVFIFVLMFKEIRKGVFDVIIIDKDNLVLSRFGKKAHLGWERVEDISIITRKGSINEKCILIKFLRNSNGEDFELKVDYNENIMSLLTECWQKD